MASVTQSAGTGSSSGSPSWTGPTNIISSNDSRAACSTTTLAVSGTLRASNFGFAIPSGSVINGVEVAVECRCGVSGTNLRDQTIQLVGAEGAAIGNNYADTDHYLTDADVVITYGGSSDLWGATLTPDIVNDSDFGVNVEYYNVAAGTRSAQVDHISITVYYTEGAISYVKKIAGSAATSGSPAWNNPDNIKISDSSRATLNVDPAEVSGTLIASNFGFAIPVDRYIHGVVVEIQRQEAQDSQKIKDYTVRLVDADGNQAGHNFASTTAWLGDDSLAGGTQSYGADTATWGLTLTPEVINDADFGVALTVTNTHETVLRTAGVNAVWITVYHGAEALNRVPLIWMIAGNLYGFETGGNFDLMLSHIKNNFSDNPHIDGVLLGGLWKYIEPTEGVYDWSKLDDVIDEIIFRGHTFMFMMTAGIHTPDWLMADPDMQVFETIGNNPYRDTYGETLYIPIPWNELYQEKWFALISAAAAHLTAAGYDTYCTSVTVVPWGYQSAELHLPKTAADLLAWDNLGAEAKLLTVFEDTLDLFATEFPTQKLALHTPNNLLNSWSFTDDLVRIACAAYESRIVIQPNFMHGKSDIRSMDFFTYAAQWKTDYPGITLASQTLAALSLPSTVATERQGTMVLTVQNVINTGFDAYFQIWYGTGRSLPICDALVNLFASTEVTEYDEPGDDEGEDDGGDPPDSIAIILRTEFVCIAYWGGKEAVLLTDGSGNLLTDADGHILMTEQFVDGLSEATRDWITGKTIYEGVFTDTANYWVTGNLVESSAITFTGGGTSPIRQNGASITMADPTLSVSTTALMNLDVVIEHRALDYLSDGTTDERIRRRSYICTGWKRTQGTLVMDLEDLTDEVLEQTYPYYKYRLSDYYMPDLLAEDVGSVVPYVTGIGTKIKCVLIKDRELLTEQVVDGNFSLETTTNWKVVGTGLWTISTGKARKSAGDACNLSWPLATVNGYAYQVSFKYACTAGSFRVALGNTLSEQSFGVVSGEVADATVIITQTNKDLPTITLALIPTEDFAGTLDDVAVYHVGALGGPGMYIYDGGFETDGGHWTKGAGWSINTTYGVAIKLAGGTATLSQTSTYTPTSSHLWEVSFEVTIASATGSFTVTFGGVTHQQTISATGTYTLRIVPTGAGDLIFTPTADCVIALNWVVLTAWIQIGSNLITGGEGAFGATGSWVLGDDNPWNMTDEAGKCTKTAGSPHRLSPKPGGVLFQPAVGAHYQVGLDYTCDSGYLQLSFGGVDYDGDLATPGGKLSAPSGSVTWYVTATATDSLEIIPDVFYEGTVDNVSIQEATPYIYSICQKADNVALTVNSVYKGSNLSCVIVPTAQYVQSTWDAGEYWLHTLNFNTEQVDFSGNRSTIYADVTHGAANVNVVTEIARLLKVAGLKVNSVSQAIAEGIATTNQSFVDWAYGWDGQGKTIRSYLDQLLLIMRGFINTNEALEWTFWQDVAGSTVATYDELLGDLVEVTEYGQARAPSTITLGYRPNPLSPEEPYHILSRTIGALHGEEHYDVPMVYDFDAADRLHNYLANRRQYNQYALAVIAQSELVPGNVITIGNVNHWTGNKSWIIVGQDYNYDVDRLTLLEYQSAVYTYIAGTEPDDGQGYLPDYSQTRPAAPTEILITKNEYDDKTDSATIGMQCTPPAVNYNAVWFEAERTADKTLHQVEARQSGEYYIATLAGLEERTEYVLYAFAKNRFGLTGAYSSGLTFIAAPRLISDMPAVTGLNFTNDDIAGPNPVIGDLQLLLMEWDVALDYRVAGYLVEYALVTTGDPAPADADYIELIRLSGNSYSRWINTAALDGQTIYARAKTYNIDQTMFSAPCAAITYDIEETAP